MSGGRRAIEEVPANAGQPADEAPSPRGGGLLAIARRLWAWPLLILPVAAMAQQSASTAGLEPTQLENIRGVVKPTSEALLSSEILARVSKLRFREGERFEKGKVLIQFDCSLYKAELAAKQAEYVKQKKTLDNNRELLGLNAIGALEVALSQAEVQRAAADVQVSKVTASRCTVVAPFSGRVIELNVNEHESVGLKTELMSILDDSALEIELIVPSRWSTWLKSGTAFEFAIDETDQVYKAKVKRLGARVDPVSQTLRVYGAFAGANANVLSGMSGTARFESPQR